MDSIDIRTQLAVSPRTRVDIGDDGVLHVLAGPVTLHLERAVCEELTTTLAKAMVLLARMRPKPKSPPALRLIQAQPALTGARGPEDVAPCPPTSKENESDQPR